MERFCHNCGSLVSGEGSFCPQCGGSLDNDIGSAVNLRKPAAETPASTVTPMNTATAGTSGEMGSASSTYGTTGTAGTTETAGYGTNGYTAGHSAPYVNPTYATVSQEEMTVGQWVLTTFLVNLPIVGLILLFVWGFGDSTPEAKKNYSRAMLIWRAVAIGLYVLIMIIGFACAASVATLPFMFGEY